MSRLIGSIGEDVALAYAQRMGWGCVARNFYSRYGEIDLICEDLDHTLVAVEVKAYKRHSKLDPRYAVTPSKLQKITQTLRYFWVCRPHLADRAYRIDVMIVSEHQVLHHLQNVWTL